MNIIWTIENILKNSGIILSFYHKNKQTEDRFIVIICMYSACAYDATLINGRIIVTLKNQDM